MRSPSRLFIFFENLITKKIAKIRRAMNKIITVASIDVDIVLKLLLLILSFIRVTLDSMFVSILNNDFG